MNVEVEVIVDYSVRDLCILRYPNHPKGCPNFGKRDDCPPNALKIEDVLDLNKTVYAVYNVFLFREHVARMKETHPEWTERQARCCLYWQPKARKQLKEKIVEFKEQFPKLYIVKNPEACGVNLTATMKSVDIELEWPPENVTYQIVLAGTRKIL